MFKKFAFQTKVVRLADGEVNELPELPKLELPSKETVEEVSHEVIKKTVIGVVVVIAAAAFARTTSEIVIHHATK